MESDLIGQTIDGQFKVLAEVGRGSWGIVYKAHQLSLDRIVALKILNKDQLADEHACERFLCRFAWKAATRWPENGHSLALIRPAVCTIRPPVGLKAAA